MCLQISSIYGKPYKNINLIQYRTQQQKAGLGNCGVFAIAYMIEFCLHDTVCRNDYDYDEDKMREHLIECFEKRCLKPFPKINKKVSNLAKKKEAASRYWS